MLEQQLEEPWIVLSVTTAQSGLNMQPNSLAPSEPIETPLELPQKQTA